MSLPANASKSRAAVAGSPRCLHNDEAIAGRQSRGLSRPLRDYSDKELVRDLMEVTMVWVDVQNRRNRDAIYRYLATIFRLVRRWNRYSSENLVARRALQVMNVKRELAIEPYAIAIFLTSETPNPPHVRLDYRMRSKWSRALRYARDHKPKKQSLRSFIRRQGGINTCASEFTRQRKQSALAA